MPDRIALRNRSLDLGRSHRLVARLRRPSSPRPVRSLTVAALPEA